MSNAHQKGNVSVSVIAGPIKATAIDVHPVIGQGFKMGDHLYFHITPDIAAQWISALETITNEKSTDA